jgi:hypothetical protein
MLKPAIAASAAALLLAMPASAAVPKLSGNYMVDYNEICQANTNNGSATSGETHSEALTVNFDPTSGTATLSGFDVNGALVVSGGVTAGYATTPMSGSGPYSNTKTTITLGGATFNIFYGPSKKGIVQSAVFNGISSGNCAASATAIHQ